MLYANIRMGFTLVELLVTIAIIGILASVAFPSYTDYVVRSNRTEGQRELVRIANLQEQYYADSRNYTSVLTQLGLNASPFVTTNGHYSISAVVSNVNGTFTLTATAQGTQATRDVVCSSMTVSETGAKTPIALCWEK
ncbi:MAG: type IV pilus assembly protein PilE [Alteromonadaceae bacterium]|jgi:type IV pilus assembly protein PilE